MSIELILLAVNINFVAFSTHLGDLVGQVFALLVLTVAAAEAAIGLAILVVYLPQPRLDRGRGHQPDEGLTRMYPARSSSCRCSARSSLASAIVLLPLLGAILAGASRSPAREPFPAPSHRRPSRARARTALMRADAHHDDHHAPGRARRRRLARGRDHHHVASVHRLRAVLDRVLRSASATTTSASRCSPG